MQNKVSGLSILFRWNALKVTPSKTFPRSRCRHAACIHGDYVYIIGGKDGHVSLKDVWRFHIGNAEWEKLNLQGDRLPFLEGHTVVSHKRLLLLFGGAFGDDLTDSALWILNPDLKHVRKLHCDLGSPQPSTRRQHSAVLHNNVMYIYGGYIDLKGSSSELWAFHIEEEEWELILQHQRSEDTPGGRHGHSAVMYGRDMWMFGGACDLNPKADLWYFNLHSMKWHRLKTRFGPPCLIGHTSQVVKDNMVVFGGERDKTLTNDFWVFNFGSLRWSHIQLSGVTPPPRMWHSLVVLTSANFPKGENSVRTSSLPYLQNKGTHHRQRRPKSSPAYSSDRGSRRQRRDESRGERKTENSDPRSFKYGRLENASRLYEIKERIPNKTYSSLKEALIHDINNYFSAKMNVRSAVKIEMIADFGGSGRNNRNDCMFIELKIFFQSSVPRLQIEQSLIRLKHRFEDNCRRNITRSNDTDHGIMEKMGRLKKRFIAEPFFFGYYSAKVASTLLCPQIELDDDEYNVSDDYSILTLSRDGFDNEILSDEFAMTPDGRMRVCLEYLQKINYIPTYMSDESITLDLKKKYLWILSLGSSGLSIICLLVGLICYAILPSLRTIPGKLIMMLMTSLLLTLIFLQLSYFVVQMEYGCIAVAIVLHFTWLSVFMSTQAANHHMWRTFTSMEVSSHTSDKILLKYLAYIFGVPTGLICVSVVCGLTLHSRPFGVYGGSNCFIRHTNMLIGLFICPVALICLTNIVFFSLTAHAIKRTPTAECNQRKRNELVIFTRLTTVTGVSWLLQIIDSFLPFTYFTFISTIINSLQGLFIFIAFIVNKRVWGLLRKKLGTTYYTESMQTRSENLQVPAKLPSPVRRRSVLFLYLSLNNLLPFKVECPSGKKYW
ncbi:hypothetical protein FSP39_000012 [Pinctada imbricata]|uniref:G-protein coupled receptors family 2 profile 2 domain-containing protein n=1 Tax=Pinctada imbricata TaxID=66713 RepID=A0AA88YLB7_PINIB|nr:hypothetical protein FSP39_000012 [Pinctada imbricata]